MLVVEYTMTLKSRWEGLFRLCSILKYEELLVNAQGAKEAKERRQRVRKKYYLVTFSHVASTAPYLGLLMLHVIESLQCCESSKVGMPLSTSLIRKRSP